MHSRGELGSWIMINTCNKVVVNKESKHSTGVFQQILQKNYTNLNAYKNTPYIKNKSHASSCARLYLQEQWQTLELSANISMLTCSCTILYFAAMADTLGESVKNRRKVDRQVCFMGNVDNFLNQTTISEPQNLLALG